MLIRDVIGRARRDRHDGESRLPTALGHETGAVGNEYVFHIVYLVVRVQHAGLGIFAHTRGAALMNIFAKNVEFVARGVAVFELQRVHDFAQMVPHGFGHVVLVFAVTRVDMERRDAPGILLFRIERDVVIEARQTLALRVHAERVWDTLAHLASELTSETGRRKGLAVEFLTSVAGEIITAQEILVAVRTDGVHIFRNDVTARTTHGLTHRGFERGHLAAATFKRRVIHQVMTEHPTRVAEAVGKCRGAGIEQDGCGLERTRGQYDQFGPDFARRSPGALE